MADLESLKTKRDQLNARIQKQEALIRSAKTKEDNRVKVLVGAAVLEQIKRSGGDTSDLLRTLGEFLSRTGERLAVLGVEEKGKALDGSEAFKLLTTP
jgi:large subunit ribosomal protein L7/L12